LKQSDGGRVQFLRRTAFHTIVRDDVILAHTDCKQMDLLPYRSVFSKKSLPFMKNLLQSQIRLV